MTEFDRPDQRVETVPDYCYQCAVTNVVDGDTVDVRLDLGFEIRTIERIRLADIDTREIHFVSHDSEEYQRGMVHTEYAQQWVEDTQDQLDEPFPFVLYSDSYERGAYGRVIGDLYSPVTESWYAQDVYDEFEDVGVYE